MVHINFSSLFLLFVGLVILLECLPAKCMDGTDKEGSSNVPRSNPNHNRRGKKMKKPANEQNFNKKVTGEDYSKVKSPAQRYSLLEFTADAIKISMFPSKNARGADALDWQIPLPNLSTASSNQFLHQEGGQFLVNFFNDLHENEENMDFKGEGFYTLFGKKEFKGGIVLMGMKGVEAVQLNKFARNVEKIVANEQKIPLDFMYLRDHFGYACFFQSLMNQLIAYNLDNENEIGREFERQNKMRVSDLKKLPSWLAEVIRALREEIGEQIGKNIFEECANGEFHFNILQDEAKVAAQAMANGILHNELNRY